MATVSETLSQLQCLYEANCFLDAYAVADSLRQGPTWLHKATPEQLVWCSRLATRLGGQTVGRWLLRNAAARFPEHPAVHVQSRWLPRHSRSILHILEQWQARPELDSGDADLDAQWLIDAAFFWAIVRDFDTAHQLLDRALKRSTSPNAWYYSVQSHVLMCEDRWPEALSAARLAWQASPNRPSAAGYLARLLVRMNRTDEAIETLSVAAHGQSYESLLHLAWLQAAKAERSPQQDRLRLATQAWKTCERLEQLAPLRDRAVRQLIARCRFDLAMLAEDLEQIQVQASHLTAPIYRDVYRRLQQIPTGNRILLNCRPLFQKRDSCLPTSIASIAGVFGQSLAPDEIARALTYNGTATWRAMAWLREQGYIVKAFALTSDLAHRLLERGVPFVYMFSPSLDQGHATAIVGIDEAAGMLICHDPASERLVRILLDRLGKDEFPFGPVAMAFVPADQSLSLDCIPEDNSQLTEMVEDFSRALAQKNHVCLARLAEQMARNWPDSPVTAAHKAFVQVLTNQLPEGIAALEQLCSGYPRCVYLQRMLLHALNRTHHTARIREYLGEIVRRGRIPGTTDTLPWTYPPSSCIVQYADLEALTNEGATQAIALLQQLLVREPSCAVAYHALGDVYMRQAQPERAALPYRLASLLEQTDEHLARTAFDSMRLRGRQTEATAFLRARVARLGALVHGGAAWSTLVAALEAGGDSNDAIAAADEAAASRPGDTGLLAYLVRFWVRMGYWDKAGKLLDVLEKSGNWPDYLGAAVHYYRGNGQWPKALELCEQWVASSNDSLEACRMLASLLQNRQTIFEITRTVQDWTKTRPDDEGFEFIYYNHLQAAFQSESREAFLRSRLQRNPQDSWAWQELGHLLIDQALHLEPSRRGPKVAQAKDVTEQAYRLAPYNPGTSYLQASLAELQGHWSQSISLFLASLRIEPESEVCYTRAWENSANLPRPEQEEVLQQLEHRLLLAPSPLYVARRLAINIASRWGWEFAVTCVRRWRQQRPDDPKLIEAYADVLLEYGPGRTAATEAAAMLEEALQQHPGQADLRLSLAHACQALLQNDRAQQILRQTLASWPLYSRVRSILAADLVTQGQQEQAIQLLQEGIDANPQDSTCWLRLAAVQKQSGDASAAAKIMERALALMPEDVNVRRQLLTYLCDAHEVPRALEVAQEGTRLYPQSPVFRHMQAETMMNNRTAYDSREAESLLRQALGCHYSYYDAADLLASLLANQYRFDEARAVIQAILPHLANASPAMGRLAWITWVSGQKQAAVDQLAEALQTYPDYQWGWWRLLNWLGELNSAQTTCRLLEHVPPAVLVDPDITARRLDLLAKAKLADEKLDTLWEQALQDFPRNEALFERRFDILIARNQWDLAEKIIQQAASFCPDSPYVLVRLIQLAIHERDAATAVRVAVQVFQRSEIWPQQTAWHQIVEAGMLAAAVQAMADAIDTGLSLDAEAVVLMVKQADLRTCIRIQGGYVYRTGLLSWLVERIINAPWDRDHRVLSATIEELHKLDRSYVRSFLRKNRQLCRTDTRVWQAIGYHLVNGRRPKTARQWVSDWRTRQGVSMTAVSYYRYSFGPKPRRRHWQDIYEASRDALERLPEDHTAVFHVVVACEALLAMKRVPECINLVQRYRNLLTSKPRGWWLPTYYRQQKLVPRLCQLADLMQCEDARHAAEILHSLSQAPRQQFIWRTAFKHTRRWFGLWKRLCIVAGIAGLKNLPVTPAGRILTVTSIFFCMLPGVGLALAFAAYLSVRCSTRGWRITAFIAMMVSLLDALLVLLAQIR